ncbi:MAG TPA: hypothetical protein VGE07_02385 [Herpetosiphonaceae bacterium]
MNRYAKLLGCLFLASLLAACQSNTGRPLTVNETRDLLQEDGLPKPFAQERVGGVVTVLMIDNPSEKGCILAGQGADSGFSERVTSAHPSVPMDQGPVFTASSWQRFYTIVCVIIDDPVLQQQAKTLTMTFEDGATIVVPADGRHGYVIANPSPADRYSNTYRELSIDDGDPKTPPVVKSPKR